MFTPWNPFSACLLAKNDHIGGDRLDFLSRGQVIPLGLHAPYALCYAPCSLRSALCAMLATRLGVQLFFKKVSHKAPPTHIEGGAFLFCLPHEAGP